jgi:hypothetical protein
MHKRDIPVPKMNAKALLRAAACSRAEPSSIRRFRQTIEKRGLSAAPLAETDHAFSLMVT